LDVVKAMKSFILIAVACVACSSPSPAVAPAQGSAQPPAPVARTVDVVDHEFGITAPDPYRWMEGEPNAERDTWLDAQGKRAAQILANLPDREKLSTRLRELALGVSEVWGLRSAGGRLVYASRPAGAQVPRLATLDGGKERVLYDPGGGWFGTRTLATFSLSPDGKLAAYGVADGTEVGDLFVMDLATGEDLPGSIPRIWAETSAWWMPDGKAFFYRQMAEPQKGVDPMKNSVVKLHRLGTPIDKDPIILGRTTGSRFPMTDEEFPMVWMAADDPNWVFASAGGATNTSRLAVARAKDLDRSGAGKTPWVIIAGHEDGVEEWFPHGDRLYLSSFKGAPNRRLISVPLNKPDLRSARVELAEDPGGRTAFFVARDALYIRRGTDLGLARIDRWAWGGTPEPLELGVAGWIASGTSDANADGFMFYLEGWTFPGAYYRYDPTTQQVQEVGLATKGVSPFPIVATEVEATSADGTKVPMSILHGENIVLDGTHPTIVEAYGAYGTPIYPYYSTTQVAWLERGGVYVVAHVRGGGEKGRQWQDDGSQQKKMNGVRDLIACGEYLIEHQYTTSAKLIATGQSMGGVLVGRAITERPDLFGVAHIGVGFVNPLRMLEGQNGANQIGELGDPSTETGYRSIFEMDPYQHIKPTTYPTMLFTIGLNDSRVPVWMTGKMAARLAAASPRSELLIRVDHENGHNGGYTRDSWLSEVADQWAFFLAHTAR
jgi:prolyl oligopeptidase